MDTKILRALLYSCDDVIGDVEKSKDFEKLQTNEKFVPMCDDMFHALSTSLTNLLSHKVSKEAHQRYSVRLHIIDILRKWCRVNDKFASLHMFTNADCVLSFVTRLIRNHLSDELINNSNSVDSLVSLTSALICLLPNRPDFKNDIERLIGKLIHIEENEKCERLLCYIIQKDNLEINPSIIEQIYISQRRRLIEEPLLENFELYNSLSDKKQQNDMRTMPLLNQLIDHSVQFSSVFQLTASFLKELFKCVDHAPIALSFIQSILKQIASNCEAQKKDIVDLYPRKLHFCVIMLKIEPSVHSIKSKRYTLNALGKIFEESEDSALILLTHFPMWLQEFCDYKKRIDECLTEDSA